MKIVTQDNFDKDYFQQEVIAENVSEYLGEQMVRAWNNRYWDGNSQYYLSLEKDDYKILNELPC